ncbi:extracellular solute-binding protein [Actibacterium sp. XHP0104]|uniref:extracellular solute-binding protein n=1 Tax=Actibacterium sp. XHP0104 TaxID=2984335 RepID=UPI0021E933B0|nr:extracellular solute-binding protein [Actibacterium sp. XHP0104]MCV2882827.1 extracellular solute-binding protein [Actibacterium sp. XHP0104]
MTRPAQVASPVRRMMGASLLAAGLAALSGPAWAEGEVIRAHGISTFGNLKYGPDFPHLDYVNPDAPKGGEISIWAFGSFDSMHPYTIKGRAAGLSTVFFESLLTGTADEIGSGYCLLCESLEYPEDRSWVIFHLRPEAKFSDGTPLTAEDVEFSYQTFKEKGLSSFRTELAKKVESVEVIDPHTIKFNFAAGIPTRDLPMDVGGIPVFSKAHYIANNRDFEANSLEPLLGSGAYVLGRMDVGKTVVYTYDPDYWGADLPINRGRSNFASLRIEYYADYNAAFEGFKGGSYTFRNEASSKIWATGYEFPAVQSGFVKRVALPDGSKATGQAFALNLRRDQFQDRRVREAIGLMFNFEWSNETLFYGIYQRVNSFWENTDMAAEGLPGADELALLEPLADLLPPGVLDQPAALAPVSGERQLDRKNLRRASTLLDEAGWDNVGNDGMRRNAAGETLRIEFLNDSQTFDRVINPYVENLRRLGVDAVHVRVDNAEAENRERPPAYDFDVVTTFMQTGYVPGSELRQFFGSETADSSTFNKMGLKNEAVDRLIDAVMAAESEEQMKTAVRALDRVLRAEMFWVPQWYKATHTVAYYDMYEHPDPLPPYDLGHLDFWWYNAEKAEKLKADGAF